MFVVFHFPLADLFAHLFEISEEVKIEHFISDATVESFDKCILIWFPRFDVVDEYAVFSALVREDFTQEFRAAIGTQNVGHRPLCFYPIEQPHQTCRSE